MAKKRDELLDHDYDGIREYDNPLPGWWTGLFYGTIVFAAIYIPYYYLGFGLTSAQEYEEELAEAKTLSQGLAAVSPRAPGAVPPVAMPSLAGDPAAIAAGKEIFTLNCTPCHGPQGQGGIGANLTDNYWIHGNQYEDMVEVITKGVPDKGMISWQAMLNPDKIRQVAAFVHSLKGSNPPNPKAPQGDPYPD